MKKHSIRIKNEKGDWEGKTRWQERFDKIHRRVRVTATRSKIWLSGHLGRSRSRYRWQHPLKRERPTGMEPKRLIQQCGWKDCDRGSDLAREK